MQVTETLSDGLKREFQVVVPAADLTAKADERLNELKGQVRLNGFRQGKVPVSHLKRLYGRSAMAEAIAQLTNHRGPVIRLRLGKQLALEWAGGGAADAFVVAQGPLHQPGPWAAARLRVVTPERRSRLGK